jgi:hypothetical protein
VQSLGLSLDRIKGVLVEPGTDARLREVPEALLVEIEGQLAALEERRDRIRETLDREDPELPEGEPRVMRLAEERMGEYLKEASPSPVEQERKVWATARGLRLARGVRERARVPGTRPRAKPRRITGCARAG